jgi:hypothetical protein
VHIIATTLHAMKELCKSKKLNKIMMQDMLMLSKYKSSERRRKRRMKILNEMNGLTG